MYVLGAEIGGKSFLYLDAQLLHELGIYEWDRQLNCKK